MLVPNADGSGRLLAKLLDFGIAKLMEGKQAGDLQTNTDMVLGTPAYMSPEQCRGANKVDGRADVYSLGVMLYEMLGGRRPFIAEGSGGGAVFGMHMYEEPKPIRDRAPNVPENVAALVHRLLIKDRNLRPTSSEVVQLIQQISDGGAIPAITPPVSASSTSLSDDLRAPANPTTLGSSAGESPKAASRRRQALISAALLGAVALAAIVLVMRGRSQSTQDVTATTTVEKKILEPNTPPVAPRTVTWNIVSVPPGAEVVNKSTGSVLGPTPLLHKQPAAPGQIVLSIRRPGYQPVEVTLDGDSNHQIDRRLLPAGRSPVRASAQKSSAGKANSSPAAKPETPRAQGSSPRQNFRELLEK